MRLPFETSIATVCLSGDLPGKLMAISKAGFDSIELWENDLVQFYGTPHDVRRMCRELGLRISVYQPFRDLEGILDSRIRKRTFERLEQKLQIMQDLGTDCLLLCSNVGECTEDLDVIVTDLRDAADMAKRYNVRIAYEALGWGTHVNRWENSWKIVEKVNHPHFGLCLDTFHIYSVGDNVDTLSSVPGDKIFLVQLADAPSLGMSDLMQYSRHYRVFPYQAQFPLTNFLRALQSTGYKGPYSLEVFNDEFKSDSPIQIALDGFRSLVYLHKNLDHNLDRLRPVAHGIEFVEFVCSFSEINALHQFISDHLGFQKIGKHKSKSRYLYRYGQCYFIICCQPQSHTSAFSLRNGASVHSIGVRVNNVDNTVAWARDLNYPVISLEGNGIDEEPLVAIQAPDDSLIYLVNSATSTAFLSNFILTSETPHSDVMVSIDYVSRVLYPRQFDKTVLFYTSLFALELHEKYDIIESRGLVRSYAMISKAGNIQMCLNVSSAESTVIGRFLSLCGPGIHHISLRTDDIFSILPKMTNNILPLPQNYFDDLGMRLALSSDELARLNRENIMYDVDSDGEFLHACTYAFKDRFFFELVERRGLYSGYGGQNVAIRMSVQQKKTYSEAPPLEGRL